MRKIVLFIATSLDGFLADREGKVDWLAGENAENDDMVTYQEFIQNVDTIIMGWNTYRQIAEDLMPGQWPYEGMETYVVTHRVLSELEGIRFVQEDVCDLVRRLKGEKGGDIWICGGADIVGQLQRADLIDRYHISVIPVILGEGIRLFGAEGREIKLRCLQTTTYNGITDLVYERR